MKIEGMDWLDWLHARREESERERKLRGISGADWLKEIRVRAEAHRAGRENRDTPVAREGHRDD